MKNITARNEFLYFRWDGFDHVMSLTITLEEQIDGAILDEAVQEATLRYPYFMRKVIRHGEDYRIEFNEAPVPVIEGPKKITLGGEEANGHFLAVSYEGTDICFDVYHNMTDGKGLVEWVKTVIYIYLRKMGKDLDSSEWINLPGEEMLPMETADPYDEIDFENAEPPIYMCRYVPAFIIDNRYAEGKESMNYSFRVNTQDMIRYAKRSDGSPTVVLAYFIKETLRELYPDRGERPLVCSVPHSFRHLFNGENNAFNDTLILRIVYSDRMNALPYDTQLTCSRGMLILFSDPDNLKYVLDKRMEFAASVDELSTVEERRSAYRDNIRRISDSESAVVSYMGQMKWGCIEEYIRDFKFQGSAMMSPILLSVYPLNGWFYVSMRVNQTADIYAQTIVRLLNESGILTEYIGRFGHSLCSVDF